MVGPDALAHYGLAAYVRADAACRTSCAISPEAQFGLGRLTDALLAHCLPARLQAQADAHVYVPALRVDPESRAALLTLPGDAIAVLPIVSGHIADFEEELIGKVRK
jgi:hypothetical protein